MAGITEPIPFRLLIDEAVKLTRRHFRSVYLPVAVPMALVNGLVPVAQALWLNTALHGDALDPARMVVGMSALMGVALLAGVVWGLGYGALLIAAVDALQGQVVSMKRAWLTMIRPRVFGTCLLVGLSVIVGCVLCLLPGLFLSLLFSLILPVMAAEGRYGIDAITRSAQLVRYNPQRDIGKSPLLKVFLLFFLGYVLSAAVGFIVQLPFVIAQQILIFRSAAEGSADPASVMATATWLQVPGSMLNGLVTTAVQVYMAMALALFYFDLRRRQEGSDLEAAIHEMARGPEGAPPPVAG